MKTKYTNNLTDYIYKNPVSKMWKVNPNSFVSMGDGVRFRVAVSPKVDYVYVKYLSGFEFFDIEFGGLVGTEYDVLDRITKVPLDQLLPTISRKLFF